MLEAVTERVAVPATNRSIYVVFSSTPYKMGRFIRVVTHNRYNHVAISLDSELRELYAFARHYRTTPFYGGFVRETAARYRARGRTAQIKVCALPVTEEQYLAAVQRLSEMAADAKELRYNLISAMTSPLHIRVRITNAYTCVEFAADFLRFVDGDLDFEPNRTYAVRQLEQLLEGRTVYEGEFPAVECDLADEFEERPSFWRAARLTLVSNAKLVASLFRRRRRKT